MNILMHVRLEEIILNAAKCFRDTHMTPNRSFMKFFHEQFSKIMSRMEPNLIVEGEKIIVNGEIRVSF